jgi:hypothetical protein
MCLLRINCFRFAIGQYLNLLLKNILQLSYRDPSRGTVYTRICGPFTSDGSDAYEVYDDS